MLSCIARRASVLRFGVSRLIWSAAAIASEMKKFLENRTITGLDSPNNLELSGPTNLDGPNTQRFIPYP